uniref:Mast cell immunoglobulin like receptor 1 n=1 Tax=Panthera tigris altaica TaxID=74533 RepID=A0A8C9JG50_PANTA
MWKKSFLMFLFSLSVQRAALDCEWRNKLLSPSLNSKTNAVTRGQNVSLICSSRNPSLQITYLLFRHEKHLRTQEGKGEPMIFNLSVSEAHDLGPYKCKVQVSNCSVIKYSHEFNFTFVGGGSCPFCLQLLLLGLLLVLMVIIPILTFWILPKYRAAMRDQAPRDNGNTPMEIGIYANVCETQAVTLFPVFCPGTGHSQEIHYATPMFQEVAPGEAYNDCKTGSIYSELIRR